MFNAFPSFDSRVTDANSSTKFICQARVFNLILLEQLIFLPDGLSTQALLMPREITFADDVYVKAGGALRSNHKLQPEGH